MTQEDQNKDQATQVAEETRVSPATSCAKKGAQLAPSSPRRLSPRIAATLAVCAVAVAAALGGVGYAAGWFASSSGPSAEAAAERDNAPQDQEAPDQQDATPEKAVPAEDSQGQGDGSGQATADEPQSTAGGETGAVAPGTSAAAPSAESSGSASGGPSSGGSSSGSAPAPSTPAAPSEPAPAPKPATITVTVSIDSSRAQAYSSSWPSSMGSATLTLNEGATVYDALCAMGVSIGGSSYYVSSINGLAEKACGATSGWTYSVNGVFPNKACGRYVLSGGESVRWVYSTDADPTISM